ncbi:hypothetical protein PVAG01_07917 [Phlyctema vagabunda]|uniref:Uncharacterized protein n=1 Tax=Phlyctema vagabunda TaxID=108571 RepID=A0ABR4PDW0_9HELO
MSFRFSIGLGLKSPFSPRETRLNSKSNALSETEDQGGSQSQTAIPGGNAPHVPAATRISFPIATNIELPPLQGLDDQRRAKDPNCLGLRDIIWGCLCDQLFLCQWQRQRRMKEVQMMQQEVRDRRAWAGRKAAMLKEMEKKERKERKREEAKAKKNEKEKKQNGEGTGSENETQPLVVPRPVVVVKG